MNAHGLAPEDQQRMEAAAAWWMRLQADAPAELSAEFQDWIAAPENSRAFQAVECTMTQLDDLGASPAIMAMRQSAIGRFRAGLATRWLSGRALRAMAAAALLIVMGAGAGFYFMGSNSRAYATQTAQRSSIALDDGSRILLDADSEVDVRYSKAVRAVVLTRGRARFDVAHDASRPFTVTAATETVTAVGTSFDVELRRSKVVVTLIVGRVRITHAPTAQQPANTLIAGQQLVAGEGLKPAVVRANLDAARAWDAGHLVFRGEPLADAVEQVNRYARRPLIVDASAGAIRISGVFNAGDTNSFVSAVTGYFPIEAAKNADGTVTLRKST